MQKILVNAHIIWDDLSETHTNNILDIPRKGVLVIILRYSTGEGGHYIHGVDNYYLNVSNGVVEYTSWMDSEAENEIKIYELRGRDKETFRVEKVSNLPRDRIFTGILIDDDLYESVRMRATTEW